MADLTTSGAHEASSASSTYALIGANVLTIAAALWFDLRLKDLMLVYWFQSVLIGISFFIRMLFRTRQDSRERSRGKMHDRLFNPFGKHDKLFKAFIFLLHYGFFHLGYLLFLRWGEPAGGFVLFSGFGVCALAFVLNQSYSLWHSIRSDRAGNADVASLFWLPYARVIPMHLTIIFGHWIAGGGALLFFVALKTVADVLMQVAEQRILRAHVSR
jgi:hypothetical protein